MSTSSDVESPDNRADREKADAIISVALSRHMPKDQVRLRMLTWEELTQKAHRAQKQVARLVTRLGHAAGLPRATVEEAARAAAHRAGEPYYQLRRSPHSQDPTVRGFFQPPEWREQQRLRGIEQARVARDNLVEAQPKPVVRRRPRPT